MEKLKKILLITLILMLNWQDGNTQHIEPGHAACPGEAIVYQVVGVPPGCQVAWTITGAINVNIASGQQVTVVWPDFGTTFGTLQAQLFGCTDARDNQFLTRKIFFVTLEGQTPNEIEGLSSIPLNSSSTFNYSVDPMTNANSYEWVLPSGWSIVSGAGTSSINVTPNNCGAGTIKVRGKSECPEDHTPYSSYREKTITRDAISSPGAISASKPHSVCNNRTPITYSISPVTGATSYVWTKPSGWTGSSTSNSITLTPNGTNGGIVTVKALGCNQTSATGSYNVNFLAFDPNPNVTGPAKVCTSNSTFSVQNLPAGASVSWSKSGSLTYVSGQGTNGYVVKASSSQASGSGIISATVTNACGNSIVVSKSIWIGKPLFNGDHVTGPSTLKLGSNALYTSPSANGKDSYQWYFPDGGFQVLAGQGTTTARLEATGSVGLKVVELRAHNSCGYRYEYIYIDVTSSSTGGGSGGSGPCPTAKVFTVSPNPNQGNFHAIILPPGDGGPDPCLEARILKDTTLEDSEASRKSLPYEDPVSSDDEVREEREGSVIITNYAGVVVYDQKHCGNEIDLNLAHLEAGMYIIHYKFNDRSLYTTKFIKQ